MRHLTHWACALSVGEGLGVQRRVSGVVEFVG